MLIQTSVKNIRPDYPISATFEHQGVAYDEPFNSLRAFKIKVRRTKDTFKSAVDYVQMRVIHPLDLEEFLQ